MAVAYAERVNFYSAPHAPSTGRMRIGALPGEAHCFQHRAVVDDLDAAMADNEAAVICQVLHGTGGVGKTQLAAHYARRVWDAQEVDLLVWINAGSRDAIVSAYVRAGKKVVGTDDEDPDVAAQEFLTWLETTDQNWLVVLDDLAEPSDLNDLWPPRNSGGRTIVTTRRRDGVLLGAGRCLVEVDLFTSDEALKYLKAVLSAHRRRDEPGQIHALAKELGRLPLALAQAAAYVIDRDLDCVEYRRRFADRRRTLAELVPEDGALPDQQRITVAAAWSLSIELADQLAPRGLARPMIQLACMLDANGIPISVLTSPPALEYLNAHRTLIDVNPHVRSRPMVVEISEDSAREALHCLRRLSLADFVNEGDEREVHIHGLTQRATRDQLTADELGETIRVCGQALLHVWPAAQTTAESSLLRANAEALSVHAGPELWSVGAQPVLFEAGRSLSRDGLLMATATYWQQLRAAAEHHLGPDHPDTLLARRYVAGMQGMMGDTVGAVAAVEELLLDHVRVQGPDHPDTLSARGDLADRRGRAGDRSGALAAWEELLADRQRIHGPGDPRTLSTRNQVANWRAAVGDRAGAIAVLEELLVDRQRMQGPDHPDTLSTRAALAHQRGAADDRAGAIEALKELLVDRQRIQGPDHRVTLSTRGALADCLAAAGDRAGALAVWEELLVDRLRVQGPDDPGTLATRAAVAGQRAAIGDPVGSIAAWEQQLAARQRLHGPDDPRTLAVRAAIAEQRWVAGDRAGAVAAQEELLADRMRIHGFDDSRTLSTDATLTAWRSSPPQPSDHAVSASRATSAARRRSARGREQSTVRLRDVLTAESAATLARHRKEIDETKHSEPA